MKRTGICPRCGSDRVGHLDLVPDLKGDPQGFDPAPTSPQHAGVVVVQREVPGFFGSAERLGLAGPLEAYVCTDCGLYETYVKDPSSTPFSRMRGFSWVAQRAAGELSGARPAAAPLAAPRHDA